MKKIFITIALLSLFAGTSLAGYWQMESHLPQGPIDDMAVTGLQLAGGTMIAVIGGNSGGSAINGVYYYEIGNQNWHDGAWGIPQYPHPVYGLAAVTISNGTNDTIYPCGGYLQDLSAYGDSVYYPIWMSGWYPVPGLVMQTPRMNHGLVVIDHDLYAVGGTRFGGAVDSTVEILRLNGGTVSAATPMPQSRTEAVVVKALGSDGENHIYVIGGRTNSGALLNSVIQYDTSFSGGSWSGKTSMPGPGRWMATGAVLNNKIYVMGGTIDLSGNVTRRVDIYDPQTDTWAPGDSLPLSIIRAGAYGVNNVIYFFGGFDKGMNAQCDSVWQYHPLAPNFPPLIRPLNNALINNQSPVFYWGEVPAADGYRIQVSSDPTFMTIDIADYTSYSGTDTSLGGVTLSPAGDFYWRVKTYDWAVPDSSSWSPVRRLTLDLTPPSTPYPATPSDGWHTNNPSVNFSWSVVTDAKWYRFQVDTLSDYSFSNLIINDSTLTSAGTTIDLSAYGYTNARFFWRVEAIDSAGNVSGYHSYPSFTLDMAAPSLVQTYPFNGNTDIDPNADIILGFSETINPGTFSFSCNPDPGSWFYNWSASGDTVIISHAAFPSNSTITATINTAQDLAGNNFALNGHVNPWYFTTKVDDTTPPSISVPNTNYGALYAGSGLTFTVNITDNAAMGQVTLYWGPAGYSGYTGNSVMSYNSGNANYECPIPGTSVLPRGLQYQIVASDSAGNYSYYPAMGDYYIHSVHFQTGTTPIGTAVPNDQWHMISIPADARGTNIYGQLENELGYYDQTKWRLFIWGSGNYGEITNFGSGNIYKLGQAYWLRHRLGGTANINFEGPDSSYGNFNQSKPCSLILEPGWADIGSPFMFNIDWMNVTIPGMVAGPYYYDGTKWLYPSEVFANNLDFTPGRGFSFRNDNGFGTDLVIYPNGVNKSGKAPVNKQPNGWQALVTVENGNGSDNNHFGLSSDASLQRDQYDYPEPPSGLTGTSGYFRLVEDQFCTDIRPELGDGQTWDFAVECNGQTKLTITLPVEFPAGTECYLADLSRQVSVNIKDNNTYSFTPEPGETVREFKIVAGQTDYAKDVLGSSFALPSVTLLAQNRPNPLRDNTSISYQLSADGPVKLAIYNVAGQLVKTIVNRPQMAGRYTVSWNGRDESGRQAATGVYFYRLTVNGTSASRTMNLIK
ncbi:Ig-like domain-containing protein [candidate division TA06 bacterium]|nr:Ig-like domain-containing protein [candidate division TA06 bacterium]